MSTIFIALIRKSDIDQLSLLLQQEQHRVIVAENGVPLKNYVPDDPAVLIVDAAYGAGMVEEMKKTFPLKPVLCLLPQHDGKLAVELMRAGAFDCFIDVMDKDDVMNTVTHALRTCYGDIRRGEALEKKEKKEKSIRGKKLLAAAAAGGAALLLLVGVTAISRMQPPAPVRIDLPYENPTAITALNDKVWIGNWFTQSVYSYKVDKKDARLLGMHNFGSYGPVALTQQDNYLWTLGNDLVLRQHMLNDQFDVLKSYRLTDQAPSGMVFIGGDLWVCDSSARRLYRYSLSGGILAGTYDIALAAPVGPAWDGEFLWLADARAGKLALYKQKMDSLEEQKAYHLPYYGQGVLSGIALSGKNVCLLYAGNPSYVIVTPVRKLKQERSS